MLHIPSFHYTVPPASTLHSHSSAVSMDIYNKHTSCCYSSLILLLLSLALFNTAPWSHLLTVVTRLVETVCYLAFGLSICLNQSLHRVRCKTSCRIGSCVLESIFAHTDWVTTTSERYWCRFKDFHWVVTPTSDNTHMFMLMSSSKDANILTKSWSCRNGHHILHWWSHAMQTWTTHLVLCHNTTVILQSQASLRAKLYKT